MPNKEGSTRASSGMYAATSPTSSPSWRAKSASRYTATRERFPDAIFLDSTGVLSNSLSHRTTIKSPESSHEESSGASMPSRAVNTDRTPRQGIYTTAAERKAASVGSPGFIERRGRHAQALSGPRRHCGGGSGRIGLGRRRVRGEGRLTERSGRRQLRRVALQDDRDRKSTRLNSSHGYISYAVFCF